MEHLAKLTDWMINDGRRLGDPVKVVSHFCASLIDAGVPLWRANIGQRFANPLLIAWGVVWKPEETETYDVTHEVTLTDSYVGSSFEYILENRKPLHKSLRQLDPKTDHISYLEFAEQGGTDYYATLLSLWRWIASRLYFCNAGSERVFAAAPGDDRSGIAGPLLRA